MAEDQRIVILADTHVGDRTSEIAPSLLRAIETERPDRIFHAGDVCTPETIQMLSHIAPTDAVQGNRDWFMGYRLPMECRSEINGVRVTLAHGLLHCRMYSSAPEYGGAENLYPISSSEARLNRVPACTIAARREGVVLGASGQGADENGQRGCPIRGRLSPPGVWHPNARYRGTKFAAVRLR